MSHFIKICKICGNTISQCRCMSCNKTVEYDLCPECKKVEEELEDDREAL
jgi:hypothetical protein